MTRIYAVISTLLATLATCAAVPICSWLGWEPHIIGLVGLCVWLGSCGLVMLAFALCNAAQDLS